MQETIYKECRCGICEHIIRMSPNEVCPKVCPACQDGKPGIWTYEQKETRCKFKLNSGTIKTIPAKEVEEKLQRAGVKRS